jgi:multidrug transporter EmrE-like cation transporter
MANIAYLLSSIALMVYSNIVVKARTLAFEKTEAGAGATAYVWSLLLDPWVWTAAAATGMATLMWLLALRHLELGVAQPTMALVFVGVPLAAAYFLDEPLPSLRIVGLVLIVTGVLVVAKTA